MRRVLVLAWVIAFLVPLRTRADDPAPGPQAAPERGASGDPPRPDPARPHPRRRAMRHVSTEEAVVSSVISAAVLAAAFVPYHLRSSAEWRGGIGLDDSIRGALRLDSASDRAAASSVSDALVGALVLAPALIDAVLTAWLVRGDPELMGRMLLMNLQAQAIAQGITAIFKNAVGRERPNARACREDPVAAASDPLCQSDQEPASFFSGHASLAFTSAALICYEHTQLGLLGEAGDAAMCATGLALATTVGLLRIVADRHYASDVLIGAGVGLLSGWLVPQLLHFDVAAAAGLDGVQATIAPMVDSSTYGVQVLGVF